MIMNVIVVTAGSAPGTELILIQGTKYNLRPKLSISACIHKDLHLDLI